MNIENTDDAHWAEHSESSAQFGHVSSMDQDVNTTADVNFNSATVNNLQVNTYLTNTSSDDPVAAYRRTNWADDDKFELELWGAAGDERMVWSWNDGTPDNKMFVVWSDGRVEDKDGNSIGGNAADIATNTAAIATNTTAIAANASDIDALEAKVDQDLLTTSDVTFGGLNIEATQVAAFRRSTYNAGDVFNVQCGGAPGSERLLITFYDADVTETTSLVVWGDGRVADGAGNSISDNAAHLDQDVLTTSDPTFNSLTLTGGITVNGDASHFSGNDLVTTYRRTSWNSGDEFRFTVQNTPSAPLFVISFWDHSTGVETLSARFTHNGHIMDAAGNTMAINAAAIADNATDIGDLVTNLASTDSALSALDVLIDQDVTAVADVTFNSLRSAYTSGGHWQAYEWMTHSAAVGTSYNTFEGQITGKSTLDAPRNFSIAVKQMIVSYGAITGTPTTITVRINGIFEETITAPGSSHGTLTEDCSATLSVNAGDSFAVEAKVDAGTIDGLKIMLIGRTVLITED